MDSIKKLAQWVSKNGFVYKLVDRTDKVAIYAQYESDRLTSTKHWEVFKIRLRPYRVAMEKLRGEPFPELPLQREQFPSDEDFGKTAWCFMSLAKAGQRYKDLCNVNV